MTDIERKALDLLSKTLSRHILPLEEWQALRGEIKKLLEEASYYRNCENCRFWSKMVLFDPPDGKASDLNIGVCHSTKSIVGRAAGAGRTAATPAGFYCRAFERKGDKA
jgi:hypothetical protein